MFSCYKDKRCTNIISIVLKQTKKDWGLIHYDNYYLIIHAYIMNHNDQLVGATQPL